MPRTPRGLKQMAALRVQLSARPEPRQALATTVIICLPCLGEGAEEGRRAASKLTHQEGGLWAGGVPETDRKECVFVWEKGPSSGVSCSSSAVFQRVCSSSSDLCFAACEMDVVLVLGVRVALRE